jgi:DNA-binding transcriptional LysR family regulator
VDRTRALTLFLAVVRAGSFSRAAVEAGLTPQAMSKAVRQLEAQNVRLLHRTTRKLSMTDEVSRLFELADPGMRILDDAVDQVHASREAAGGTVRVVAPPSLSGKLLVPLIREYQQLHPTATSTSRSTMASPISSKRESTSGSASAHPLNAMWLHESCATCGS